MAKWWLVARHEYLKITRKRSFVISTLAIPGAIVIIMALVIGVMLISMDGRPIGYVDQAGVLSTRPAPSENSIELLAFADEAAARAALQQGQLQAYYVLAPDYPVSRAVQLFYWDEMPAGLAQREFDDFVRQNLGAALPPAVTERLRDGFELTARSGDGRQELSGDGFLSLLLPFFVGLFFTIVVLSSGTDLLSAVTDEKENRTIEVMVTSVAPGQLIVGKSLGLLAVALTQIAILFLTIVLVMVVGAQFFEALSALRVPWPMFLTLAIFFLPTFALIAGMMIAVGSVVSETRQGQQIAGAFSMLFTLPFFFMIVFFTAPNSTIATILTLFPTTSFLTIALRWSMTTIPLWQMVVGWVLVTLSALGMVWLAARLFHLGMLNYGQRLEVRNVLRALRG
jgi:ABC-2 type transport system permease protein